MLALSGKKTQLGRSSTLILDSIISFSFARAAWRAADSLASRSFFHWLRRAENERKF